MSRIWMLPGVGLLAISLTTLGLATTASADAANGKTLYTTNCVACHGENGDGKGAVGAALNPPPRDFSQADFKFDTNKDGNVGTDADLTAVVKNGAAAYGGSPLMAPWGHLSEKDIADLITYIRTFKQ